MKRGFTLVELMVALVMGAVLVAGIGIMLSSALSYVATTPDRLTNEQDAIRIREKLRGLLSAAFVSDADDDTGTYFIAENSAGAGETADVLTFSTLGVRPSGAALHSDEEDFNALNDKYGPQGGVAEVSISTTAVGDAGEAEGVFLRLQNPSDGDPTQGGRESLLINGATGLSFEFWDGSDWVTTWDTRTMDRRVPAAVRVNYTDSDDRPVSLTVRLENSDVTQANPITQSTTGGGP